MSLAGVLEQAKALPPQERKELMKLLLDTLDVSPPQKRRLSELRGLGKEIWKDIDAQEYVNELRDEWNHRP